MNLKLITALAVATIFFTAEISFARPTDAQLSACEGLSSGASCSSVEGEICTAPREDLPLACVNPANKPERQRRQRGEGRPSRDSSSLQ